MCTKYEAPHCATSSQNKSFKIIVPRMPLPMFLALQVFQPIRYFVCKSLSPRLILLDLVTLTRIFVSCEATVGSLCTRGNHLGFMGRDTGRAPEMFCTWWKADTANGIEQRLSSALSVKQFLYDAVIEWKLLSRESGHERSTGKSAVAYINISSQMYFQIWMLKCFLEAGV
jgi:hypothetical protein